MGKVDAKSLHRSGKVPIMESAKSTVGSANNKGPRKLPTCSICKSVGHRANGCKMPPDTKRRVTKLVDIDLLLLILADACGIRPSKRRKQIELVPVDEWI